MSDTQTSTAAGSPAPGNDHAREPLVGDGGHGGEVPQDSVARVWVQTERGGRAP
jgi:hypothetical protein